MFPSWHHGTPACLYLFSLAGGDGAGEPEMFPCLGQKEQQQKSQGQGRHWHRDRMSWQDCPESGPPHQLPQGVRAYLSFQDCEQWGTSRAPCLPQVLVQEGQDRPRLWKSTPGGGCRRTHSPTSDKTLGKSP